MLPEVPVTVTVYVPTATLEPTEMESVEVFAPVTDVGLKASVTPAGAPDAVNAIAALNPPTTAVETEALPDAPCARLIDVGEAVIEKPGAMVTASAILAVCATPPEVPVSVMT